jgi:hypothetical protein
MCPAPAFNPVQGSLTADANGIEIRTAAKRARFEIFQKIPIAYCRKRRTVLSYCHI